MEIEEMVMSVIGDTIGNIFGEEPQEDETLSPCFRPGLFFDVGYVWVNLVRHCLVSGSVLQWHGKLNSTKDDLIKRSKQTAIAISLERERAERERSLCNEGFLVKMLTSIRSIISNQFEYYLTKNEHLREKSNYCEMQNE